MYKIGATNFRKFQHLEPIEIRPITFFVGRNNSGKSSVVKAIMLLNNYLTSKTLNKFSFGNNISNETNVVSFGRAKNREVKESNSIEFLAGFNEFEIRVVISGKDEDAVVEIREIILQDKQRGYLFEFDFRTSVFGVAQACISSLQITDNLPEVKNSHVSAIDEEIELLEKSLSIWSESKFSKGYIELVDHLNHLRTKKSRLDSKSMESDRLAEDEPTANDTEFTPFKRTELNLSHRDIDFSGIADALILDIETAYESVMGKEHNVDPEDDLTLFYLSYKNAYYQRDQWAASLRMFSKLLKAKNYCFVGATSMKQSALLSINDTGNPLAMAVHDYYQNNLHKVMKYRMFATRWFKKFEIGNDFYIKMLENEGYTVKVRHDSYYVPIADKGMGAIQAFTIILKIAFLAYQNDDKPTTVLLEEPELNLHPALQSLLADMLLDAHERFKLEFIVETHSEYLIRNTQQLVKEKEFEVKPNENPFGVVYFDKDQKQWRMNYREDGVFIEDFGTGFFDVSTMHALNLFKKSSNG
jgi:predicted ATPase